MKDWFKKELAKVSSGQWLISIKTCTFCLTVIVIALLAFVVYSFIHYANTNVWWVGFIFLGILLFVCMVEIPAIFWLKSKYKEALQREKEATEKRD